MKNQGTKVLLLLPLLLGCDQKASIDSLRLNAVEIESEITVSIVNESNVDLTLEDPTYAVTPSQTYGLDALILDKAGTRVAACAMVESPNTTQKNIVKLNPGRSIDQKIAVGTIKRRYCLGPGAYKVSFILRQPQSSYESNTLVLAIN
ncbi:hypothetical protein [Pseudoxanthomonas mexicana]|uniref:hypothetical protein n=1 Tax=Pseudoxanthomonas mexicana TaxID=128785 RepID=UPI0022F3A67C|nr:hypothetical protein [Pseudoxanthomonas mexicana]WBX94972.1 hypothetical protein PE064_07235 [Pseudoxanthomonas mexicana]